MNVVLKSFSEDVPLANPKNVQRFLVFDCEGEELRVPVGPEAIMTLAKFTLGKKSVSQEQPAEEVPEEMEEITDPPDGDVVPEGASEFGGDEEGEEIFEDEEDEDPVRKFKLPDVPSEAGPKSEDEVPSL